MSDTFFIRRALDRTGRQYDALITAEKDREEREILRSEKYMETDMLLDGLAHSETRRVLRKATRMGIPTPDLPRGAIENDAWERCPVEQNRFHLKTAGLYGLRSLIRQERRERRDYWLGWLPLITGLTGLFGALAGLVAWLLK